MHLNLEGTKHEKAVILILAYVVGFITGFITFGVTIPQEPAPVAVVPAPLPNTAPTAGLPEETLPVTDVTEAVAGPVSYVNGRLNAFNNGASVLLSIQKNNVDEQTASTFAEQGVHTSLPTYSLSPDGLFIFYCEQHSDQDECTPFMYDLAEDVILYVTVNGEKVLLTIEQALSARWVSEGISIGTALSADIEEPWKLLNAQ